MSERSEYAPVLKVSLRSSLVQVTIGGVVVAVTGALIGQA